MKICLMGSHGVGKTTLLNEYKDKDYEVFPEITRELMSSRIIDKDPDYLDQTVLLRKKCSQFAGFIEYEKKAVIDRSPIDVEIYSCYLLFNAHVLRADNILTWIERL